MAEKKSIIELVAVAVEFCSTLESATEMSRKDFVERTHKLLSLLYMKAAVLSPDADVDDFCEHYVTEKDWETIRQKAEERLGSLDNRIEMIEPDSYTNRDSIETYLSECFADIYQDARNFVELCKDTSDEGLQAAAGEFILNYKLYWGTRVLALLTEFHNILFASDSIIDNEEE
ncbi:MAG: DUF5063 domain-containing protein [Bacteroidales bacterium]|nr:DUF5063 domain-containing protein [Bacteroidales bacterium]